MKRGVFLCGRKAAGEDEKGPGGNSMKERHDQSNHRGAQRPDPHQPQNAVTRSMRIRAGVVAGALVVFFGLLVYVLTTYQIRDTEKPT